LDALALLLYGDELGVQQAPAASFGKSKGVVDLLSDAIMYFLSNLQNQMQRSGGMNNWWKGVESLNLPSNMRTYFNA
jgi:hypothetical protein